jgi:hypothetical protein
MLWIRIRIHSHSFWSAGSGSGSRTAKITQEREEISTFEVPEDFSCCLDVLYGGLGIRKLQFLVIEILDPHPDPHYPEMLYLNPDPR